MFKKDQLMNHAFDQACLLCNAKTQHQSHHQASIAICRPCMTNLPWQTKTCCPQCGLGHLRSVCGQCLKSAPYFDSTYASMAYNYPIDSVLQHFKYQKQLSLTPILAKLLLQHAPPQQADYIIPMPMHPKRLQERGFNQSLELAKIVSKTLNIPVELAACKRILHTPPQAGLALKERAKNIKGAFQSTIALTGKNIIVIDDVMTSGASLNELAKTLKNAGANQVSNWVVARTLA